MPVLSQKQPIGGLGWILSLFDEMMNLLDCLKGSLICACFRFPMRSHKVLKTFILENFVVNLIYEICWCWKNATYFIEVYCNFNTTDFWVVLVDHSFSLITIFITVW
jgi:hypothetical protein